MRRFLVVLIAVGPLGPTVGSAAATESDGEPPERWRSYWVDAFNPGIYPPEQVSTVIDDALAVNANALIVQTAPAS